MAQYNDKPKNPNIGIRHLCMCRDNQQQPTNDSDSGNTIYWCKRCGLYLGLRDMDAYYQSEATDAIKRAHRKQNSGGT